MGVNTLDPLTSIVIFMEIVPLYMIDEIPFEYIGPLILKKKIEADKFNKGTNG